MAGATIGMVGYALPLITLSLAKYKYSRSLAFSYTFSCLQCLSCIHHTILGYCFSLGPILRCFSFTPQVDLQGQGRPNDYCRFIENGKLVADFKADPDWAVPFMLFLSARSLSRTFAHYLLRPFTGMLMHSRHPFYSYILIFRLPLSTPLIRPSFLPTFFPLSSQFPIPKPPAPDTRFVCTLAGHTAYANMFLTWEAFLAVPSIAAIDMLTLLPTFLPATVVTGCEGMHAQEVSVVRSKLPSDHIVAGHIFCLVRIYCPLNT